MRKLTAMMLILAIILSVVGNVNIYANELAAETEADLEDELSFDSLADADLRRYMEDTLYANLVNDLNSDEYFVENVSSVYISKEYLEEVAYNSQANIYFGYTLAELEDEFQESKYVFTLGDDGQTVVTEFEDYDDTYDQIIKNVAIGSGVILLCVTVTVATGGFGTGAALGTVNIIFSVSAKAAGAAAASGAAFGGVAAGIIKGIESKDLDESLRAAALGASEGFKWGAITGAVTGGASAAKAVNSLKGVELTGLTLKQAVQIQLESRYPVDVIKQFHTMDEYKVFKDAQLVSKTVGKKSALIREIDLNLVDEKGRTNLQRMKKGLAAVYKDGDNLLSYDLHHVGQRKDGTLAILTKAEHDSSALHGFLERTEAHATGTNWDAERKAFWKALATMLSK